LRNAEVEKEAAGPICTERERIKVIGGIQSGVLGI